VAPRLVFDITGLSPPSQIQPVFARSPNSPVIPNTFAIHSRSGDFSGLIARISNRIAYTSAIPLKKIRKTKLYVYPVASAAALLVLCALDCRGSTALKRPITVLSIAGLAMALGGLNGALWQGAFSLTQRLKITSRIATWFLLGLGASVWLSSSLGAFSRIGGRYHDLALVVIASCLVATVVTTALVVGMQPLERYPLGFIPQRGRLVRTVVVVAILASVVVLWKIDATAYPELYDKAHFALRVLILWFTMFATIIVFRGLCDVPYLGIGFWGGDFSGLARLRFTRRLPQRPVPKPEPEY